MRKEPEAAVNSHIPARFVVRKMMGTLYESNDITRHVVKSKNETLKVPKEVLVEVSQNKEKLGKDPHQ